jgi:hypothetical protein
VAVAHSKKVLPDSIDQQVRMPLVAVSGCSEKTCHQLCADVDLILLPWQAGFLGVF